MARQQQPDWGGLFAWLIVAAVGGAILSAVANNPKVNPQLRLIAQDAESQLFQDVETQALYLLKDGVITLLG